MMRKVFVIVSFLLLPLLAAAQAFRSGAGTGAGMGTRSDDELRILLRRRLYVGNIF